MDPPCDGRNIDSISWAHDIVDDSRQIRRSKRIAKHVHSKFPRESSSNESDHREPKKLTLFTHLIKREIYGLSQKPIRKIAARHLSRNMPSIFREQMIDLGTVNKVFASQWINDYQVVMGTKCNKILIRNVYNDNTIHIPSLKGTGAGVPAECPCGIHAIAVNPSRTLLATGAENTNDLAVYRLPSFDPVFLGEEGHSDWLFDVKWIDDQYCITGSRDSKLALWRISESDTPAVEVNKYSTAGRSTPVFGYKIGKPEEARHCSNAEKIRALAHNEQGSEIGVLSLNNKIHTWDVATFQQKDSRKLPQQRENVCMAFDPQRLVYAVGSQSHVTLLDYRTLKPCLNIESIQKGFGIRSVSFHENMVTIGTGLGSILFYDLNAGKYLQCNCGHTCILKVGAGYLLRDSNWRDYFSEYDYANAIYTHCYDDSGTRLFTAGGPLPAGLVGNYAGVWQ